MKKLIAAAVIAMSSVGCQYASADTIDELCEMQAVIIEKSQRIALQGNYTKDQVQSKFAVDYIESTGSVNVAVLSLTMGVIEAAYDNRDADTSALMFAAKETCYQSMGGY